MEKRRGGLWGNEKGGMGKMSACSAGILAAYCGRGGGCSVAGGTEEAGQSSSLGAAATRRGGWYGGGGCGGEGRVPGRTGGLGWGWSGWGGLLGRVGGRGWTTVRTQGFFANIVNVLE